MSDDLVLRHAETAEDLERIRAIAGEADPILARHLARPRYQPAFTRLAERAGHLVGYLLVAHRRQRLGSAVLEVGAVEYAYVLPEQRRRGVFGELLGDALGMMYEQGLAIVTLHTQPARGASLGFAPFLLLAHVELAHERAPAAVSLTELPAAADFEELSALYEASYGSLPLSEVRFAPDWRDWLARQAQVLVLRDNHGRTVGYARLSEDGQRLSEAAAADAGAALMLLNALPRARGQAALALDLPVGHVVARAALELGAELRIAAWPRAPQAPALLAGVVDLPAALEALAPLFEQRLSRSRYAGWNGAIRLELEAGRATLLCEDGRVRIVDGTRPAEVRLRRMTLQALPQLLLGYRLAADLRAAGELDCDDTPLGLIDALFPLTWACEATFRS